MLPNYRLQLTARIFLAERPQLNRSVRPIFKHLILTIGHQVITL